MMVGRLLSYWEGNFSGAMLNFGRVSVVFGKQNTFETYAQAKLDHFQGLKDDPICQVLGLSFW